MDKKSPFGPMQKRAERSNVTGFPGKQWRDVRQSIKLSSDPIDVSLSEGNPRDLHREVDMRVDEMGGEPRQSVFNKALGKLGL